MNIKKLLQGHRIRILLSTLIVMMSLSTVWVVNAQDETSNEIEEMPQILVDGIEELSEDFPEILDVEWVKYTDRDITIWLQNGFELVLVEDMLELAERGASLVDPQLQPFVQMLAANPEIIRFVAMNGDTVASGFVTNIIFIRERPIISFDALEIAQATVNLLPDSLTVRQEPAEFELDGFDSVASAQWNLETLVMDVVSLAYIIADDGYIYSINVSTLPERADYDQALTELSLKTLVIDREADEDEDE